jgi:hypothetical protein
MPFIRTTPASDLVSLSPDEIVTALRILTYAPAVSRHEPIVAQHRSPRDLHMLQAVPSWVLASVFESICRIRVAASPNALRLRSLVHSAPVN